MCPSLLEVLNPNREPGRLTLITRYGASKVRFCQDETPAIAHSAKIEQYLPSHIAAVQELGYPVAWVCDPMHGK